MAMDEESLEETPLMTDREQQVVASSGSSPELVKRIRGRDPRKSKTSYAHMTIVYTVAIAFVMGLFCFTVASTITAPSNDKPIEMEEEGIRIKTIPVRFDNHNILNKHEQGDDDYTSDYHPYYHRFVDKDLWLNENKAKYHIHFFDNADFNVWNEDWTFSTVEIGKFRGLDPDGNLILSNGTFCHEAQKQRSGIIKVEYGTDLKLMHVNETESCYYEMLVTSPEQPSYVPSSAPSLKTVETTEAAPVEATGVNMKSSTNFALSDVSCGEGYYRNRKGFCTKALVK